MPKRMFCLLFVLICLLPLSACAAKTQEARLTLTASTFPPYDFLRALTQDVPGVNLTMLLSPGEEVHSFEPSPRDILTIGESRLFVHVGGESDAWVQRVLESCPETLQTLTLFSCVELLPYEHVEGMEDEHAHEHDHEEKEMDEHVWLDPLRAIGMVETLSDTLSTLDPDYADIYRQNCEAYCEELRAMDGEMQEIVSHSARQKVVFADRFPARYFAQRYGLSYAAAFPGCSSQTEASAATVAFLIDTVKQEAIPAVFYTEFSDRRMADALKEATGCETVEFHSAHNVSLEDFQAGVTYAELMRGNLQSLRKALS